MGRRNHVKNHNSFIDTYRSDGKETDQMPNSSSRQHGLLNAAFHREIYNYFRNAFSSIHCHYVAIATVFFVVLLSYMLPNVSQKIHRTSELKTVKKVLDVTAKEVSLTENSCISAADKIGCLHCNMQDDSTETASRELARSTSLLRATQSVPARIEPKRGFLKRIFFPHRNATIKEVTIMSYLYTESFDGSKRKKM